MLSKNYNSESEEIDVGSDEYYDGESPESRLPSDSSSFTGHFCSQEREFTSELVSKSSSESCTNLEPKDLSPALIEKQEWVKSMRLQFCRRKEFEITFGMIHDDGTINQDYFRPKLHELQQNHDDQMVQLENKKWSEEHKNKLAKGILECGIGRFREISEKYLPEWSVNDLRLKTIRLIGRQNLQLYRGWKGDMDAIMKEFEFNKQVGLKFGAWKNSVLVYDDEGKVADYLSRHR